MEAIFNANDYIVNRSSGDMAIVDKVTPKGYYRFKAYYSAMFDNMRDVKNKMNDMQVNYQKFFDKCTDDERKELDDILRRKAD